MAHPDLEEVRPETSDSLNRAIGNCTDCETSCTLTTRHCLTLGGEHASVRHILALADCAEACAVAAHFIERRSGLHILACELCVEACEECAASCERLADSDVQMKACAEFCRRCAESCRELVPAA